MGGVVRHTQHTLGTPLLVFPGCVGYCAWGARSSPRKPTYQHIFGSGETGVSVLTLIATLLYYLYESVDTWRRSRPGEKENDPYTHDKIRDAVERLSLRWPLRRRSRPAALMSRPAGQAPAGPRPLQRRRRPSPHGRLPRQGQGTRPLPPLDLRLPDRLCPPLGRPPPKRTGKPWLPSTTQQTVRTGMTVRTG